MSQDDKTPAAGILALTDDDRQAFEFMSRCMSERLGVENEWADKADVFVAKLKAGAPIATRGEIRIQLPEREFQVRAFIVTIGSPPDELFQYEQSVKPDYCNAGGLNVFEDGEWVEWHNDAGDDIDYLLCNDEEMCRRVAARRPTREGGT